jgi:zinc protease
MFLEADRMKNISFSDEAFEKEHKVIIEERLSRYENNPKALFSERLRRILWGVHPYGEPVIGYSDEIKAIEKKDVMTFYKNWYTPNNAILVVAGDVKPKKVFSLANKYFGKIPATKLPKRTDVNTSPEYINAKIKTKSELVKQPILKKIFVTPSIMIDNDRLAYPLEILNEILGSDMTSKLYQSLVIEQKKTVSISSWYNGKRLGNGTFSIYASPSNGVSLEELDKAIDLEINKIFEQKISKKEVEKAKKRLSYGLVYLKDEPSTAARILGSNLALGYPLEEIETWEEKINQVSTKDVNKAFDYLINKASNIVGYLSKD